MVYYLVDVSAHFKILLLLIDLESPLKELIKVAGSLLASLYLSPSSFNILTSMPLSSLSISPLITNRLKMPY